MYQLFLEVLAVRHIEMDDGIFPPFRFLIIDIKSLKQFLATLKKAAQRVYQQRLAETTRTAEEEVDGLSCHQLPDILRLIDIHRSALANSVERLYAYGVASVFTIHLCHITRRISFAKIQNNNDYCVCIR